MLNLIKTIRVYSRFPGILILSRLIETRDQKGYNGDQWESVFNLIKLCQAVRLDVEYRLGKVRI